MYGVCLPKETVFADPHEGNKPEKVLTFCNFSCEIVELFMGYISWERQK